MTISEILDDVIEENYDVKMPISILKELAQELEKKTKGLLIGEVNQSLWKNKFTLHFSIVAPSLNNYSYGVFTIQHDLVIVYPLELMNPLHVRIENQEELEEKLKEIFSSSEVKRVINGMLAQIKAT